MTDDTQPKVRRRLVRFKLQEISGVHYPAQEPALVNITKSYEEPAVDIEDQSQVTEATEATEATENADIAPEVVDGAEELAIKGEVAIEADGGDKDAEVDEAIKGAFPETYETPEEGAHREDAGDGPGHEGAGCEGDYGASGVAKAIAAAFGVNLSDEQAEEVAKTAAEGGDVAKFFELAKAGAEVVYTALDGEVVTKADGERYLTIVKQRDDLIKAQQDREHSDLATRYLGHFPGTADVHKALIKAVLGVEDSSTRNDILASLGARNAVLADLTKFSGVVAAEEAEAPTPAEAAEFLKSEADKIVLEKGVSFTQAYKEVKDKHPEAYVTASLA